MADRPLLDSIAHADIHIVGLGPGALADLTLVAWHLLTTAPYVVARTLHHPCLTQLAEQRPVHSFDALYEENDEFAQVYAEITRRVVALGREQAGLVYAVPGHPWVGEATTRLILDEARRQGLSVQVVGGVSFVEPCLAAMQVDLMDGGQVVDAMLLARQRHPQVEVGLPLLVGQLYARWLASDVKLTLMNAYPDDHAVSIVHSAGTPQQEVCTVALHELDRRTDFDHMTSLYVPPVREGGSVGRLQEIIAHLRAPDGCPWDREQTLDSLKHELLGECAEVLEAIDAESEGMDNSAHIAEELGDLLLMVVMLVQISTEEERFKMADVTRGIVTKLIRRHPHVFGDTVVSGVQEVFANWDAIKAQEKAEKGQPPPGPLDGVPAALPALEKARKLQSKAAKAGLLDRAALADSSPELARILGPQPDEPRLGELLWRLVALAHQHDLNAEDSLRAYLVGFSRDHTSHRA